MFTNGNGLEISFQPRNDVAIAAAPFTYPNPNNTSELQPFLIHCLVGGDVTFTTWGGQSVTRTMVAGETYNVIAKTVTVVPDGTSFSALY